MSKADSEDDEFYYREECTEIFDHTIASIWREDILGYLSADIISSREATL